MVVADPEQGAAGSHEDSPEPALPGEAPPGRSRPPAPETIRLYAGDWAAFRAWCRGQDRSALPADPGTLASYLAAGAGRRSPGTLARYVAAIVGQHRARGYPSPAADPAVKAVLREARHAAPRPRRLPPSAAMLQRMAQACRGDRAGLRDRALLLLAAAGLGRGGLVGLDAEQVRFTAAGVDLGVRVPGAPGGVATVTIVRGTSSSTCPVRALEEWLRASECRFGPVFRKVDRWDNVEHRRLGTDALRRIWRRRALRRLRHASGRGAA